MPIFKARTLAYLAGCVGAAASIGPEGRLLAGCNVGDRLGQVQQTLAEDSFGGVVVAFRGGRAGLIKLIWL